MKRVLLVKTSALGDIVQTYPVVSYLKCKFPGISIDWAVEKTCATLVETHPEVDEVFCLASREWRRAPFAGKTWQAVKDFRASLRRHAYDAAFDLQGNIKSGLVLAQVRAQHKVGFGRRSVAEWPNMLFTNHRFEVPKGQGMRHDYLALVAAYFGEADDDVRAHAQASIRLKIDAGQQAQLDALMQQPQLRDNAVVVCPGSAWRNKQLPPETLIAFLKLLKQHLNCAFVFLWGSPEELALANQLHAAFAADACIVDKMPLPMVQNLMHQARLVVAMDSLPLHLAGSTGTPTFSCFGPSSAAKYKPPGNNHAAYQGECPYGRTFDKRCPLLRTCPTGACLRHAAAEVLFANFRSWWDSRLVK